MATPKHRRVKPPKEVQISYQKINVLVGPCDDLGFYEPNDHRIRILEKQKWSEESNTLLHELFHAVYHCYNLDQKSDEEKIVNAFANGMMEAMTRNPELRKYFQKVWDA